MKKYLYIATCYISSRRKKGGTYMRKVMAVIYPVLTSIYSYIFITAAIYSLSRVYLLTSGSGDADAWTVGIIGTTSLFGLFLFIYEAAIPS